MSDSNQAFDPYHQWLGIPPSEQPPSLYRLLGISPFETNAEVIANAADQRMAHLKGFAGGRLGEHSQRLLNEVSRARVILLDDRRRHEYDARLRQKLGASQSSATLATKSAKSVPAAPARPTGRVGMDKPRHAAAVVAATPIVESSASASDIFHRRHKKSPAPWIWGGALAGTLLLVAIVAVALTGGGDPPETASNPDGPGGNHSSTDQSGDGDNHGSTTRKPRDRHPEPDSGDTSASPRESGDGSTGQTSDGPTGTGNHTTPAGANDSHWPDFSQPGGSGNVAVPENPDGQTTGGGETGSATGGNDLAVALGLGESGGDDPEHTHATVREPGDSSGGTRIRRPGHTAVHRPGHTPGHTAVGVVPGYGGTEAPRDPDDRRTLGELVEPAEIKRIEVPEKTELAEARAEVRQVFSLDRELERAEAGELVGVMMREAEKPEQQPAETYILLEQAAVLAVDQAELGVALRAVEEMERRFNLEDATNIRLKLTIKAVKSKVPLQQRPVLASQSIRVLDEGLGAGRYEEVEQITEELLTLLRRAGRTPLTAEIVRRREQAAQGARHSRMATAAMRTLKETPDDPRANRIAGRFLAFHRHQWEKAWPMLAQGDEAVLRDLAKDEIKLAELTENSGDEDGQVGRARLDLADAWFDAANGQSDEADKLVMRRRAAHWYQEALPAVEGLRATKAQRRLNELAESVGPALGEPVKAEISARSRYGFELYVNGEKLLDSEYSSLEQSSCELRPGDVITVRALGRSYSREFCCVITFENRRQYLATGDPRVGWRAYQPKSPLNWYKPESIGVVGPCQVTSTTVDSYILRETNAQCLPIWSGSGDQIYLALTVRIPPE
jgi:hypothetical protein